MLPGKSPHASLTSALTMRGKMPASSSLRMLSSYCAAVNDAGAKRIRTLIEFLLGGLRPTPSPKRGGGGNLANGSRDAPSPGACLMTSADTRLGQRHLSGARLVPPPISDVTVDRTGCARRRALPRGPLAAALESRGMRRRTRKWPAPAILA